MASDEVSIPALLLVVPDWIAEAPPVLLLTWTGLSWLAGIRSAITSHRVTTAWGSAVALTTGTPPGDREHSRI